MMALGKPPALGLELRRVILFTDDLEGMLRFYGEVLGLPEVGREPGWVDFDAGACRIALHKGKSEVGSKPPKLAFYAADVTAARQLLIERGVKMGKLLDAGAFQMCNFKDPDGNSLQISGRA
jgi:catechol 2,3-dioxygenase-like lactoylglutathione lyase family enzyme